MIGFSCLLHREWLIAKARFGDHLAATAFFVLIALLFVLSIGTDADLLQDIGIGIIWTAACISALPAFDKLFADDVYKGWLEQIYLSQLSVYSYIFAKILIWYLFALLPILLITPFLLMLFYLPMSVLPILLLSLIIGLACLHLIGAITSALTLGARRRGVLLGLLTLPLSLPIVIFGVITNHGFLHGLTYHSSLSLLTAFFLFLLVISPIACHLALRFALEDG